MGWVPRVGARREALNTERRTLHQRAEGEAGEELAVTGWSGRRNQFGLSCYRMFSLLK